MKKKIAIFEDDAVNRFIYERLFRSRKDEIELYVFTSPNEGIAKALDVNFDVVLIEVHFWENFGGIAILQKLREINAKTTFIAMTSLLQNGDLERLLEAGFTLCVEKPMMLSEAEFAKLF